MCQEVQAPPYWNNKMDHLSKSSHLMEAKRAIDTSLPVSKEQNTERQGLKMNENVSSAQSDGNVAGPWPGIICQLDLFQPLSLTSWESFFPPTLFL